MWSYLPKKCGTLAYLFVLRTYLEVHGLIVAFSLWEHVENKRPSQIFLINLVPVKSANSVLECCELLHWVFHLMVPLLYSFIVMWFVFYAGSVAYIVQKWLLNDVWEHSSVNLPENSVSMAMKSALLMLCSIRGSCFSNYSWVISIYYSHSVWGLRMCQTEVLFTFIHLRWLTY